MPDSADPTPVESAEPLPPGPAPEATPVATLDAEPMASTEPTPPDEAAPSMQLPVAATELTPPDEAAPSLQPPAAAPDEQPRPEFLPFYQALEAKSRVRGQVIGWNKGGFHVSLDGVPAFCPKSQIELGNPKKAASYVDRDLEFHVLEIRDHGKRIVVTRAKVLAEDRERHLAELRQKLKSGEPVAGTVSSLTDFGAFVDLGGLEGLVHLSALSRQRVEHPRDLLSVGQDVQVRVTKIEKGGERISLSMKALEPDPWKAVDETYQVGEKYPAKILRKSDFGLFVELQPGLEGLVHTSQLPLGVSLDDATLAAGGEIEVWVREAEPARHRLSLSMREIAKSNPWQELGSRYSEGTEIKGTVEQVARFGVFVQLEPGLTGLLPFSTLSLPDGVNPQRAYRPGQEMSVLIGEIDTKRRRISLMPAGSRLEGTKADLRDYQKRQRGGTSLNAMASAFAKLQRD